MTTGGGKYKIVGIAVGQSTHRIFPKFGQLNLPSLTEAQCAKLVEKGFSFLEKIKEAAKTKKSEPQTPPEEQ